FQLIFSLTLIKQEQLTEEQKDKAREIGAACIAKEGVTKEQALALREGKFDNTDEKVKCFAKCFLEELKFLVDGQLKPDAVEQKLGPIFGIDTVKAAQAKCDSLKGANECDTAFQLFKCYHTHKAEL
ncbi:hypothetical protein KR222_000104, partial [Zaprionus bogoriensis]